MYSEFNLCDKYRMVLSRPEGGLGDTNLDFGKSVSCWQFQKDCLPALIKQPVAIWNRHLQTVICRRFVASVLPGCPNQRHVHSFCSQRHALEQVVDFPPARERAT